MMYIIIIIIIIIIIHISEFIVRL